MKLYYSGTLVPTNKYIDKHTLKYLSRNKNRPRQKFSFYLPVLFQKLIKTTKAKNESFHENSENQIKHLTKDRDILKKQYEKLKKGLTLDIKKSEKRLTFMTICSNNSLKELDKMIKKGENIMQIITCCRRLETEDEKNMSWSEMRRKWYERHGLLTAFDSSDTRKGDRIISSARKITEKDLDPESQVSLLDKENSLQLNQPEAPKKKEQSLNDQVN